MSELSIPVMSNDFSDFHLDEQYQGLLNEIRSRLRKAQLRAATVVNRELVQFYWETGKLILERQAIAEWGDKVFDVLAADLKKGHPGVKGFSRTNLIYMRLFAKQYPDGEFGQTLSDQLTWSHHIVLIQMIDAKDLHIKQWYAQKTIENIWSSRELRSQINADLYSRQTMSNKTTNFKKRLPPEISQLAEDILKDTYRFHFLSVNEGAHEREIQNGLIESMKRFLMELGQGFAFYRMNYPVMVSDKRFEIDLLMYNTRLHCYVVVELKRGDFQPKDTGQLNFYLTAVDAHLRGMGDGPTIGLILCEKKDQIIAEYALQRIDSPVGIAEYTLSRVLPKKLQGILPSAEMIEAELSELKKELSS